MRRYSAGIYRDPEDARRSRWAVCGPTDCWTFPARFGERAARALAAELNSR